MSLPKRHRARFGYGIDDPYMVLTITISGILFVFAGVALSYYIGGSDLELARVVLIAGPFVGILMLVLAESLFVSSRAGKIRELRKLAQDIPWGGEETVLDLGCGRGPLTVIAARRLTAGRVVALDTWNRRHVSANSPYSLMANAEIDKVDGLVLPVFGTSTSLPFPDETFDVIVSGLGLTHVEGANRMEAARQMAMALKKGGRLAILVSGHSQEFSDYFSEMGLVGIEVARYRIGLFPPVQKVSARKPYSERGEGKS